jgi:WD40 repeat protein/serine/threonine protein kinase
VDRICDRFEAAWLAGERPRIEEFVRDVPEPEGSTLLRELLRLELHYRTQAGEKPTPEEYQQRFPEQSEQIRSILHEGLVAADRSVEAIASEQTGQGALLQELAHDPDPTGSDRSAGEAVSLPGQCLDSSEAARWPTVPSYEILRELGRGGMGVVYEARQIQLNRLVALKMILTGGHAGEQELARFRTEAEAVARLQHPNIVQIHEVGEAQGRPFFSLEYVDGGSLDRKTAGTPLPPRQAARLVETLAGAMDAAHRCGIIHRDLKPANVLLARTDPLHGVALGSGLREAAHYQPKITDFGLAKKLDAGPGQTASGAILGTPSYMAPEQAGGQKKVVGPLADVYALGAILYELLTGRPPFRAATVIDTLMQVLTDEPVPPSRLQPKLPRDLETICLKCLHKEPGKRYATAAALAEDLQRFLEGRPIAARPVGRAERAWRWCRRNPVVAGLLAGVAASLVLGTVVAWVLAVQARSEARRAEDEKTRADEKTEEARAKEQQALSEKRRAEWLAYASQMGLAQREWQDGNLRHAGDLLAASPAHLRGWEYNYLYTLVYKQQRILRGHKGPVNSVAFGPDSKRLASASLDQTVTVWDSATGKQIRTLKGHTGWVLSVAFSPDGKHLASGGADTTLRVWDIQTGQGLRTLKGHSGGVQSVAYSPDGQHLVSASADHTVRVWDMGTGQSTLTLKGHAGVVSSVAFSPDGKRLVSGSKDGTLKVWDAQTGQELLTLKGESGPVSSVAFSPDGQRLASGSARSIVVWDAQTGQELLTFKGHTLPVTCVAFSPDGKCLASGGGGGTGWPSLLLQPRSGGEVKVWDARTGQETLTLKRPKTGVRCVAFSPDGQILASANEGIFRRGTVRDATTHQIIEDESVLERIYPPSEVELWPAQTVEAALTLKGHADRVSSVAFSPDSKTLASASEDHTVKVWDVHTGQETLTFKGHTGPVDSVTFSPDGKRLVSASGAEAPLLPPAPGEGKVRRLPGGEAMAGEVKVWDARTGQEALTLKGQIVTFKGQSRGLLTVAFSPDGQRLLGGGSQDNAPKLWDARTGQRALPLKKVHVQGVNSVAFSPDGQRLASASADRSIKVWDAQTGQVILTLRDRTGPVHSVAFSPDGQHLATGGGDNNLKLWDAQTGEEILTLEGHIGPVHSVAFSPDGKRLASGSDDKTVKVWDTQTGQETLTLRGHTAPVSSVAFSPDGKRLASASADWTVKIWDASCADGQLHDEVAASRAPIVSRVVEEFGRPAR